MNSTIGYSVFKKTQESIVECNGIFDDYKFIKDEFIDVFIELPNSEKLWSFKKIVINKHKPNRTTVILVTLIQRLKKNGINYKVGSAIVFKEWQVNEKKIIDGVIYLLAQLKQNIDNDYDLNEKDLGIVLPSINKDFGIFKNEKLVNISTKEAISCYHEITLGNPDISGILHDFCVHESFRNVKQLMLSANPTTINKLSDSGFKPINNEQQFVQTKYSELISNTDDNSEVNYKKLKQELPLIQNELKEALKKEKTFRIISIITFSIALIFGVLLFFSNSKNTEGNKNQSKNALYPIQDVFYIKHTGYNVNVRNSPIYDFKNLNVVTTLSDGDQVFVLGLDKETLWAKIRYNNMQGVGYVSNAFIEKQINQSRIKEVSKPAKVYSYNAMLFSAPGKEALLPLEFKDDIFVKNQLVNSTWFSVMFTKNNKTYNGYLKGKYFKYQ